MFLAIVCPLERVPKAPSCMSSIICSASFLFTQRSKVESWLRLYRVPLLRKNLAFVIPPFHLIFLQQFKDRHTSSSHMGNKSGDVIQTSQESSDLFLGMGYRHFLNGFNLGRINLNTFAADDET